MEVMRDALNHKSLFKTQPKTQRTEQKALIEKDIKMGEPAGYWMNKIRTYSKEDHLRANH
ncbi:hypothetical protein YC2023_019435 [Brassica napus]